MNKILIIRNEPDTLSDLGKLLCGDFDILETSSGKEAIEILQSEDYNVSAIILSAYLSCDNSFSLLDALCNNIKSTRIPVIAAVKAEDDSVVERAFALGACDCISAPYKPLIIKQRIANAVKLYKAEDEADESHDDMRLANQLVEDSSSSVYVCDANTYEMLYVNKNCARMCGKRVGEAKGKRCYEFLKNASKPCTPCYMETTVYNEYTEREYSSPPTGKHYITRGKFIDWGGRKALVEYFIDETERITQQNQLQDLVNKIPGGIGIYELYPDGSMKLVYLNDGYYSLIGTQRENRAEYFNSSFSAAMHPDDVARAKNDLLSVLDGTRTSNTDFRVMSGSGEYKWLNARSRVAHKTDEKATIYVTYTDIDQEKKNHLQLEASRHVLSLANQEGQVSLWLYDIDNRRVVYNFISGIPESVENIPQRLISEGLVQPEDAKTFLDAYERMFSAAQRSECLVRMLNNKSGAYEWYHLVLSRLKDNYFGGNMAFGMATNVNTQQKTRIRYERELILRNELLKDAIVYTVVNLTTGLFEEYQDNVGEDYSAKPAIALDEAIEHEILQRIDEADRELVKASVFPAALREIYKAGESTSSCVFRRKVSGGTTHWVKATVNILPKPDTGDIVAFMYITDIDSEVKDKQALECVTARKSNPSVSSTHPAAWRIRLFQTVSPSPCPRGNSLNTAT